MSMAGNDLLVALLATSCTAVPFDAARDNQVVSPAHLGGMSEVSERHLQRLDGLLRPFTDQDDTGEQITLAIAVAD